MLYEDRAFEYDDLSLMREDPDEHLLATDVGRDDYFLFEVPFTATPGRLQTRTGGSLFSTPTSPLGSGTVAGLFSRSTDLGYTPHLDLLAAYPNRLSFLGDIRRSSPDDLWFLFAKPCHLPKLLILLK